MSLSRPPRLVGGGAILPAGVRGIFFGIMPDSGDHEENAATGANINVIIYIHRGRKNNCLTQNRSYVKLLALYRGEC
jgi:hypothetical protein